MLKMSLNFALRIKLSSIVIRWVWPLNMVSIFECTSSIDEFVIALKEELHYPKSLKDPQGSRFHYLYPSDKSKPLAVGIFPELDKAKGEDEAKEIIFDKKKIDKEIYKHWIDANTQEQPVLYLITGTSDVAPFAFIKPTQGAIRKKLTSIYTTNDKEKLESRLSLLAHQKLRKDSKALFDIPVVDVVFYDPIVDSRELARRLAVITREIEETVVSVYNREKSNGKIHQLLETFRKELIKDLKLHSSDPKVYGFSDLYAQTIAYGMFSARCFKPDQEFSRESIVDSIPPTNPFLKELFSSISNNDDLDDELLEHIEELIAILSAAKMDSIMADFHRQINQDDIIIHFYETYLKAYNPEQRDLRGVYYTPASVVSYMVRSVDLILKDKFGIKEGLIDGSVKILDPATGTGTFLDQIIKFIHQNYKHRDNLEKWNEYVKGNLLPRLFGFELMMAPYAVAHLKLGLELQGTGYTFNTSERLKVYLANTLDKLEYKDAHYDSSLLENNYFARESIEAENLKKNNDILVIIGNPPYSGHSANDSKFFPGIGGLIQDYYQSDGVSLKDQGERNTKWLQDDYVKFIRFAQWKINRTGSGIVALITNHGFVDNPTFRGMRQNLINSFSEIYILDLHGNTKKKEKCPDGSADKNVFDIQQGVSINLFIKDKNQNSPAKIFHADLYGKEREIFDENRNLIGGKYYWLKNNNIKTTNWAEAKPQSPFYLFVPQDVDVLNEYEKYFKIPEIVPVNVLGFQTHRDNFAIDFEKDKLYTRIEEMRDKSISDEEYSKKYNISDNKDWKIADARNVIQQNINWVKDLIPCLYRPFDLRACYFNKAIVDRPRTELINHVAGKENLCLLVSRQISIQRWQHCFISNLVAESCTVSLNTKEQNYNFPLYLYKSSIQEINARNEQKTLFNQSKEQTSLKSEEFHKELNIKPEFWKSVKSKYGNIEPEKFFTYMYAVFYSPTYRERYKEFLKIDFPRLPLTSNKELFEKLSKLGQELVDLHLMKPDKFNDLMISFPVQGINLVDTVEFVSGKVWINKAQYFEGIEEEIWNFHIGGYQVLDKWLKDRKKAKYTLKPDDIEHYKKVYVALKETIRIMQEIDKLILDNGGFPMI